MNRFVVRDHRPSILVASLSSAFGVALLDLTGALATLLSADNEVGSSSALEVFLSVLALVFIAIATYVGAVVTANTFATIIAGRTRTIALMRLIGATARSQRAAVAREGLIVGLIGSIVGALIGTAVIFTVVTVAELSGFIPALGYGYFAPVVLVPVVAVVLTTWLASWIGSRRVLSVSPVQATGAALAASLDEVASRRGRRGAAIALLVIGTLLLLVGAATGLISPAGLLIGVFGGMLSFTGLVLGAQLVMPPVLRLVGRMLGSGPAARLAAENAVRYPERSARTTIGLVIGVTLVTMFAVAAATYQEVVGELASARDAAGIERLVLVTVVIFSVLIGFSALIAAIGMVNNLSLSVLQRTRELGLLRALGFTSRQLRGMIRAESAQLSLASILVGLVLGIGYGWAGAQSLLGTIAPGSGLVVPVVPAWLLVVVVVVAAVLTVAASAVPARRATAVSPVAALAVE
jgi:putative ABC transport system permease protein